MARPAGSHPKQTRGDAVPVQVNLPTVLRSHAGGVKAVSVEGSTVGEVLVALADEYPGLSGQVITSGLCSQRGR